MVLVGAPRRAVAVSSPVAAITRVPPLASTAARAADGRPPPWQCSLQYLYSSFCVRTYRTNAPPGRPGKLACAAGLAFFFFTLPHPGPPGKPAGGRAIFFCSPTPLPYGFFLRGVAGLRRTPGRSTRAWSISRCAMPLILSFAYSQRQYVFGRKAGTLPRQGGSSSSGAGVHGFPPGDASSSAGGQGSPPRDVVLRSPTAAVAQPRREARATARLHPCFGPCSPCPRWVQHTMVHYRSMSSRRARC